MATPVGTNFRIFVGDAEIVDAPSVPVEMNETGAISLDLTIQPNWPGIWHMTALSLDWPKVSE